MNFSDLFLRLFRRARPSAAQADAEADADADAFELRLIRLKHHRTTSQPRLRLFKK